MSRDPKMREKAARIPEYGTCPRCFDVVPLIWDGTCSSHLPIRGDDMNTMLDDCPGSYFVPLPLSEHRPVVSPLPAPGVGEDR